jgi:DUF2934 family protein
MGLKNAKHCRFRQLNHVNQSWASSSNTEMEFAVDQSDDPRELERNIALASRISASINDRTTIERLRAWVEDMQQRLRGRLAARRTRQEIEARARELWDQNGRPPDRDLEFWLQAEAEIDKRNTE